MPFDASIRSRVDSMNNQVSFSEGYFVCLNRLRIELGINTHAALLNDMHAKAFKLHEKAIAVIEKRIVYDTCPDLYEEILPIATAYFSSLKSLNDSLKNTDLDDLNQKVNNYCMKLKDFTFDFFDKIPEKYQKEYISFLGPCGA